MDARIAVFVVSDFADAFERVVVRKYAKLRAPKVASKEFDGPDNAASFRFERGPVEDVVRLEVCHSKEGKDLSPGSNNVFLH